MSIDRETIIVKGWILPDDFEDYPEEDENFFVDHCFYADEWNGLNNFFGVRVGLPLEDGEYIEITPDFLKKEIHALQTDSDFEKCKEIAKKFNLPEHRFYLINRIF